jgi:tripartite-type tricarboxylate transporter receptor subunit TctC
VTVVVSSSAGGGYDTLARALARFMGRHMPGHPAFVVRNM